MRWLWAGGAAPAGLSASAAPLPTAADAAQAAVDAAVAVHGGLDAVGIDLRGAALAGADGEGVARLLGAAFRVARAALWELSCADHPAIVLVLPGPPRSLEAHALHGGAHALCRSIAKEYGRVGLRSGCLVVAGASPPERVRAAVSFLASAAFVTGETLTLCGDPHEDRD